jgi:hypothetical protein
MTDPALRSKKWLWLPLVVAGVVALFAIVGLSHRPTAPVAGGTLVYEDDFERAEAGKDYFQGAPDAGWAAGTWTLKDGRLHAEKIHNAALWLQVKLPKRVRIEFDARAETAAGDLKCEVFGDGRNHQSGYILIHGGWHNSINTIARRDEHGEDRKEDNRCPTPNNRKRCVEPGVDYHWAVERTDHVLRWYLDGVLFLTYPDANPVEGEHFAFNNWEARVSFDNLRIYDLGE